MSTTESQILNSYERSPSSVISQGDRTMEKQESILTKQSLINIGKEQFEMGLRSEQNFLLNLPNKPHKLFPKSVLIKKKSSSFKSQKTVQEASQGKRTQQSYSGGVKTQPQSGKHSRTVSLFASSLKHSPKKKKTAGKDDDFAPIKEESTIHDHTASSHIDTPNYEQTHNRPSPLLTAAQQLYKIGQTGDQNVVSASHQEFGPVLDIQYPRGHRFFRKVEAFNKRFVKEPDNIEGIKQERPSTANYKRRNPSRDAIKNIESELKQMNKTFSPKSSKNPNKMMLEEEELYRPRNQMWFNPPSMTVQSISKLTNLKAHKVHSLRARFSEPEAVEAAQINRAVSRQTPNNSNIIGSPKHYAHQSETLNLKTILNNMREARIHKLKREIEIETQKEDENVINSFALSPYHNMKIWMPFHVKYVDRDENKHEKVKPGSKLEQNPSFRDHRPNMLEYTLQNYVRKLYSPNELSQQSPIQSNESRKLISSMQRIAFEGENGMSSQSFKKRPTSNESRYVLVSQEEKLDEEARKRVMQDLKNKYIRRISKRTIHDMDSERVQSDEGPRHSIVNLFEEGRKKIDELDTEHIIRRKETKRRLKEEWSTYKKNHHFQMPTQFSQEMQQKQFRQKRMENKQRAKGIMNSLIKDVGSKSEKKKEIESGTNTSLIRTPGINMRKSDRDSLHFRVSRTYGEKLLRLNLASPPNFHDKLNIKLVVDK